MRAIRLAASAAVFAAAVSTHVVLAITPVGTAFTYQGQLRRNRVPLTGLVDLKFSIWNADVGGNSLGTMSVNGLQVTDGLFKVDLDVGADFYNGEARWIEVEVAYPAGNPTFTPLTPRQRLAPTPYALALPGFRTQPNTTSPNLLGGWYGNQISPGVVGGTVSGGGGPGTDPEYPDFNAVTDDYGTVGGGMHNHAGNFGAATNDAQGATVCGGMSNFASAAKSTVGGGVGNYAGGVFATVAGGDRGNAAGEYAAIGGGSQGAAAGDYAVVGGGQSGSADGPHAVVAGGWNGSATGSSAVVGGGGAVVLDTGGWTGFGNNASGNASTVPGGWGNEAQGDFSFAAGRRAQAAHNGTFVWADSTGAPDSITSFASTGPDQFLIRAAGGVGIGTNNPQSPLDIRGGNWNLSTTEGDFKIGDANVRLKMGIALGGGGTGVARIRAQGGANALWLGSGTEDLLFIRNGTIGVGVQSGPSMLTVAGTVESTTGGFKFPDGSVQIIAAGENAWQLTGNSGTTPASNFLGTTDNVSLELRADNRRAVQIRPNVNGPSITAGYEGNAIAAGVVGGTICGGGGKTNVAPQFKSNKVEDDFGTVSGGWNNQAGDGAGTVSDAFGASVGGGWNNKAGAELATVGGGTDNTALGTAGTVPGGANNNADGAYSFAAGRYARAVHEAAFVWADSSGVPFASTGPAQFLIRAAGGVGIGTDNPAGFQLAVNGPAAKPGGGSWSVYSDARLKKNISRLTGALSRLLHLRGVTFEYTDDAAKGIGLPGEQIGMIAQEVEKVFPEWVDEDADGYKYVTVRGLEALVVEALRELREEKDGEIAALRAEKDAQIASLEGRLAALEAAMADR